MADDEIKFKLIADTSEFTEKISHSQEALEKFANVKNLSAFIESLSSIASIAGVIGAGVFALKEAFDFVFEADQINKVNRQFDLLTKNIGINTEALRDHLKKTTQGWIDDTDAIKAANEAIVRLGSNAEKIPQIFEVAKNVSRVMGGDVTERFNQLSEAIATGNARALRSVGIYVDQNKVLIEYAKTHNTIVSALTLEDRQAALLDATLSKANEVFKNQKTNIETATTAWRQLKVTLSEISEIFTLLVAKPLEKPITSLFKTIAGWATYAKNSLVSTFGSGKEQVEASVAYYESAYEKQKIKVAELSKAYQDAQKMEPLARMSVEGNLKTRLDASQKYLEELKSNLEKFKAEEEKFKTEDTPAGAEKKLAQSKEANEKLMLQKTEFEQSLFKLKQQRLQAELKETQDQGFAETNIREQNAIRIAEIETQIQKTKAQLGISLTQEQVNRQIAELERLKNASILDENDVRKVREQALDNYLKHSTSVFDGIARAAKVSSEKAKLASNDFSKIGTIAMDSFSTHAQSAFLDLGEGSKSAGEIMKGFMFGTIADIAQAEGSALLLKSVWPPNPLGLAAGGGLIALAGFLRSQAKGAGGGTSVPSVSESGIGAGPGSFDTRTDVKPTLADIKQGKSVTIQVQGHYFETDQTKQMIAQLVRDSADATDFKIASVGGGI